MHSYGKERPRPVFVILSEVEESIESELKKVDIASFAILVHSYFSPPRISYNMAFFEDIRNFVPIKEANTPIQLILENYVVITGHKGIKKYSEEKIIFSVRKHSVSVEGKNLKIVYLSQSEAYVEGEIKGVYIDA